GVDSLGLSICRFLAIQRDPQLAHRVACKSVGRLSGIEWLLVKNLRVERAQVALESPSDEVISRAGIRRGHLMITRGPLWRAPSTSSPPEPVGCDEVRTIPRPALGVRRAGAARPARRARSQRPRR